MNLVQVTTVEILSHYQLRLGFSDGLVRDVDLTHLRDRGPVFAPLRDRDYFAQVRVNREAGTIVGPTAPTWTRSCFTGTSHRPGRTVGRPTRPRAGVALRRSVRSPRPARARIGRYGRSGARLRRSGRGNECQDLELLRPLGVPYHVADGLRVLGAAHLGVGEDEAAEAALTEGKALATAISNPWLAGHANCHLGELARRRGDTAHAEDLHHEALALRATGGLRPGVAESLEALAGLAADQESFPEAVRLFGAASALRAGMGLARWPADQPAYDTDVATASGVLGEDAFNAAWAEGAALSVDEAVAYASRARGERKRPSTGWASLTPTELEVVKLVAKGLTNPEIGERLFIGRGTVKTHLAHVFTKLGIASRSELAKPPDAHCDPAVRRRSSGSQLVRRRLTQAGPGHTRMPGRRLVSVLRRSRSDAP